METACVPSLGGGSTRPRVVFASPKGNQVRRLPESLSSLNPSCRSRRSQFTTTCDPGPHSAQVRGRVQSGGEAAGSPGAGVGAACPSPRCTATGASVGDALTQQSRHGEQLKALWSYLVKALVKVSMRKWGSPVSICMGREGGEGVGRGRGRGKKPAHESLPVPGQTPWFGGQHPAPPPERRGRKGER